MSDLKINIPEVLNSVKSTLISAYTQEISKVTVVVQSYIMGAEQRFKNIAEGALSGELSYTFVISRLKEETVNIKDEFLSITEIIGADIQDLANQAVAIFENALKNAISALPK